MADVFSAILGQPQVRDYLRTCVADNRVSQAYLFVGPLGSNKTQAAKALSQALLCENRTACGTCPSCQRIARDKHPDVHILEPEGAQGYLVDQVRRIVGDVSLAPIQAKRKIYIINRVDTLGVSGANSFLKTLEEPPDNVNFILLARTSQSVLPTILSRCQVVPFRHIPPREAAGIVSQHTGADAQLAAIAIEACGGSIDGAVNFCRSREEQELRRRILEVIGSLYRANDWDILCASKELVLAAKAPLDAVRSQMEEDLSRDADFLSKSAAKQVEQRNKRELSARSIAGFRQMMAVIKSWLRDVLMCQAGHEDLVVNQDALSAIQDTARCTQQGDIVAAVGCVDRYDQMIAYNVSPQTCIDGMLFGLRRSLCRKR